MDERLEEQLARLGSELIGGLTSASGTIEFEKDGTTYSATLSVSEKVTVI